MENQKIYEMPVILAIFIERFGETKVRSLRGCLSIFEQLIDEYENDFDNQERKKIIHNPVFIFLDKRISDMIGGVYAKGEMVGEYPLDWYVRLNTRVENIVDLYNSEEINILRKKKRKTEHCPTRTIDQSELKYTESMRVAYKDLLSEYNERFGESEAV